jgi:hypothetical protein
MNDRPNESLICTRYYTTTMENQNEKNETPCAAVLVEEYSIQYIVSYRVIVCSIHGFTTTAMIVREDCEYDS